METFETLNKKHVPSMVEIFYRPEQIIDEIDAAHRGFCLSLLQDMGFKCVSGAAGVGSHENFTVGQLAHEARDESISVSGDEQSEVFFPGPNPTLSNGIGIWTMA